MMEQIGLEAVLKDDNFNKGISSYQSKLDTASQKTGFFSNAMNAIGGAAKIGVAGVIGIAGAAAGAAAGLTTLVMKASDTAGDLVDMSLKTGIGVERLQELKFIGEQLGTPLESITGSMVKLTRSMGNVGTSKEMAANFDKIGVSVYDANGKLRDTQTVFSDVITALGKIENPAERDALAMELFGKSATELNPLIKAGGLEMDALSAKARSMGIVMNESSVMGLESFGDSVAALKGSFQGIVGQIAGAVLPIFVQLTTQLVAFVQSPEFQAGIQTLVTWLSVNLPIAIQFLSDTWTNVLQPAIVAVWGWISGTLIPFFQAEVIPILQEYIPKAIQFLSDYFTKVWLPAMKGIYNFLTVTMRPVWEALIAFLKVTIPLAITILKGAWENILLPALRTIWNFISTYIVPIFTKVSDGIGGITGAIQTVVTWIQKFTEWLGKIKLPDWLTPGSPTPFEMGLRGIAKALKDVNGMTASVNLVPKGLAYAAAGASPAMSNYPVSHSRSSHVSINMGGVTLSSGSDEQAFIARVEGAVLRAMGV